MKSEVVRAIRQMRNADLNYQRQRKESEAVLSSNLLNARAFMHLTQEALAYVVGVTKGAISRMENGRVVVGPDVLARLELVFGAKPLSCGAVVKITPELRALCIADSEPETEDDWRVGDVAEVVTIKGDTVRLINNGALAMVPYLDVLRAYIRMLEEL